MVRGLKTQDPNRCPPRSPSAAACRNRPGLALAADPHGSALAGTAGLALQASRRGPVAQGIEQQPSKLKVAGSNPAGVATLSMGCGRTYEIQHLSANEQLFDSNAAFRSRSSDHLSVRRADHPLASASSPLPLIVGCCRIGSTRPLSGGGSAGRPKSDSELPRHCLNRSKARFPPGHDRADLLSPRGSGIHVARMLAFRGVRQRPC
jgi:hypothetical protein